MISSRTAKALCTKAELELVRESSAKQVIRFTAKQLNSRIARSRKLRDKFRDLASRQEREARGKQKAKSTRAAGGSGQTRKKQQLFAETLDRFQQQLKKLGASSKVVKKKPSKATATKATATKATATKSKSAKKSGSKKTASTTATKKSKVSKKTAKRSVSKAPKKPAKKKTTKTSAKKTKVPARSKKASTAAKKSRVSRSGRVRKTAHLSSTARRNQGKRNKTRS